MVLFSFYQCVSDIYEVVNRSFSFVLHKQNLLPWVCRRALNRLPGHVPQNGRTLHIPPQRSIKHRISQECHIIRLFFGDDWWKKECDHYKSCVILKKERKKWHHTHTCILHALDISEQSGQYKIKQFISLKFVLPVKPHILSCVTHQNYDTTPPVYARGPSRRIDHTAL